MERTPIANNAAGVGMHGNGESEQASSQKEASSQKQTSDNIEEDQSRPYLLAQLVQTRFQIRAHEL